MAETWNGGDMGLVQIWSIIYTLALFGRDEHSRKDAPSSSANLDFDARVPIPFSVFPSSYRSDAVSETTHTRVEGEAKFSGASRVGREDTHYEGPVPQLRTYSKDSFESTSTGKTHYHRPSKHYEHSSVSYEEQPRGRYPEVDLGRERYYQDRPGKREFESQLDITEHQFRARTDPRYEAQYISEPRVAREIDVSYDRAYQQVDTARPQPQARDIDYQGATDYQSNVQSKVEFAPSPAPVYERDPKAKMGYYDDEGHYHSFRRGVERAADRILHPFQHSHHRHGDEEVVSDERGPSRIHEGVRESVRVVQPRGGHPPDTIPIPCHFVRIGDLLILQGRPSQVIRISVSPQTGQHRYLGVDLFTRQLHEESSFISNPSPSVVVQTMLGPVYKTYRVLDLRDDGRIVAMTETGDVKQGIRVVEQGGLFNRISDAFSEGRGSVRALVINDGGRELVVDYKVIHGSRL
ncbi:hypothetical protein FQN57_007194 [Myotisia sp. PD_48]|nr:hypothetical protein FQN57_007194 [Myotisia sp. PD_48]